MNRTWVKILIISTCIYLPVRAAQMVFIDDIVTWTKDAYDYPRQRGDTNWVSPVNYKDGKIYVRYEPIVKPSALTVAVQLCFWQDSYTKETCSACNTYSSKKAYYWEYSRPGSWYAKGGGMDWTRPFQAIYPMHKDGSCANKILMTGACGSACYTKTDIDSHVPITFKLLAVAVSAGGTFVPPEGWTSPITVAAPVFSQPAGTYPERFYLELSCPTPEAQIFYSSSTTDVTVGSNPYLRPIGIGSKRTVSARAFKHGYYSPVVTMTYDVQATGVTFANANLQFANRPALPRQGMIYSITGRLVTPGGEPEPGIYLQKSGNGPARVLVLP